MWGPSSLSPSFFLLPLSLPSLSLPFLLPLPSRHRRPVPSPTPSRRERGHKSSSAAGDALRVGAARGHGGLHFFASRSHAARLIDLVTSLSSARVVMSKQLVSHVKLCLVCRDDLIFLPSAHCCNQAKKVAGQAVAEPHQHRSISNLCAAASFFPSFLLLPGFGQRPSSPPPTSAPPVAGERTSSVAWTAETTQERRRKPGGEATEPATALAGAEAQPGAR
uniref:Uncharacterized protein n=1 Tax=Oryza barthii TaxID=65489 RepID=A0A0D3HF65_9ORYZ